MKVAELLLEVPLPQSWDKTVYRPQTSFAQRVRYAQQRAAKMGTGSSRVAFEIEYEGRPTILKVARNKKGMAQNEYEAQMLSDWYLKGLQITIPMIDYDEEHDQPTWIHTEKATKMTPSLFKKFFNGLTPQELIELVRYMVGYLGHPLPEEKQEKYQQIAEENEYVNSLIDLIGNYGMAGGADADFSRLANWGVYNNEPVIVDVGASTDILKKYYS